MELSLCRTWKCQGGVADLLSSGQKRPSCHGPSRALPGPGGGQILGCVLAPCAQVPTLLDSPSRPHSRLRGAAARAPLSWSQSPAALSAEILFLCWSPLRAAPGLEAPSMRSRHPSPSELLWVLQLRGPCSSVGPAAPWALQSFRELGRGVWCSLLGAQVSVSVPGSPRASPPSWRPAPTPCSAFPPRKIGEAPASPGQSFPVLGALALALARHLVGPLPLGCLLFLYFFFPLFLP